jgi:hypothetical protein
MNFHEKSWQQFLGEQKYLAEMTRLPGFPRK